jgi:hypothetical protein
MKNASELLEYIHSLYDLLEYTKQTMLGMDKQSQVQLRILERKIKDKIKHSEKELRELLQAV